VNDDGPQGEVHVETLRTGAQAFGLELLAAQELQFHRYREGLAEWNNHFNLTSKSALADIERVHFLDSLTLLPLLLREVPMPARLIDIGSGAGFPGIPVKLLMPEFRMTLVEATGKKAHFLRWMASELGLEGVDVREERAEELGHDTEHRAAYDVALARAVGPLTTVLELTLPFCRVGGIAVVHRAGAVVEEVALATGVAETLGGRMRPALPVEVPGLREDAALVVVEKIAPTDMRFPRRAGVPARRPLTA
jgi:16S rRNA (guanine527-N7)-methyltransferase